ncbi:hypothetical protein [Bradyrhizobium lupini]|uniref:hypothetical protein n=1 Tax=Rhizobium lupini TaxID=136996 RepID=UPI0034C6BFED
MLYIIAMIPMAFDFKSEGAGAGAIVQGILLALYLALSVLFLLRTRTAATTNDGYSPLPFFAVSWFCLLGAFVGYVRGQELYSIITSAIPACLFVTSIYLTVRAIQASTDQELLLRQLKGLCLLFLLSRFAIIASTIGIDVTTVRYQILAGSINAGLGLIALRFLFKTRFLDLAVIVTSLGLVLVSVTRSQLLVAATQTFIYLKTPNILLKPAVVGRAILLSCLLLALIGADQAFDAGFTDRWIARIFASNELGADPTLLTRRAEVEFMSDSFTRGGTEFLFGNGIAAETSLVGTDAGIAALLVGRDSVAKVHSLGFGHQNYWSILFIGGIVGGAPLLALLFWQAYEAVSFLQSCRNVIFSERSLVELGAWGSTIVIGMVTYGFLAGTFGDRPTCMWYGIGVGLLAGSKSLLAKLKRGPRC